MIFQRHKTQDARGMGEWEKGGAGDWVLGILGLKFA